MKRINIGCGKDVAKGWDNLDSHDTYGANIIWDLNYLPLPIADNTYDFVLCEHVLEDFIEPLPIIDEMIRITKKDGIIEISVPNETCGWDNSLHHKRGYSATAFMNIGAESYGKERDVEIKNVYYYLESSGSFLSDIYSFIIPLFWNICGYRIMTYTFMKYLFPYVYLRVRLVKK